MERFYHFAGVTVKVTGDDREVFQDDGILSAYRVASRAADYALALRLVDRLDPPSGTCVFHMYPPIRVNGGQFGCGYRMPPEEAAQCSVAWDRLRLSEDAFAKRAEQMRELTEIETDVCGADPDEGIACRAGSSSFWLTWDGRMLPCGMLPYPEAYPLQSGIQKAWEEIRKATRQIRMPRECGVCEKRPVCAVCPAVCVTETGCFDKKPDYLCRMTEAIVSLTEEACRIKDEQ